MRIANKTLNDSLIQNLGKVSSEMLEANNIVSTGRIISKLSDDPVGFVKVLDLRSSVAEINQLERNISTGKSWLTAGESSLSQIQDIVTEAKALSVQYSSENVSMTERSNAVEMIDGYLNEIISLANVNVGGRYIFSGTNTDVPPFELTSNGNQVVYSGNEVPFSIKVDQDNTVEIGHNGQNVFGDSWDNDNFFKTMIDFKNYLASDNTQGIQDVMGNLDSHLASLNSSISDIGGKTIRFELRENILVDLEMSYDERMSQIEHADLAEAVMELSAKKLAYEAALASSSKAMGLSLVNYL